MNDLTDQQLLREYAERHSEAAFTQLVQRHIDLVHSAAVRMSNDAHAAQDITQAVFVALAQNAARLQQHPIITGWLHTTARNLAAKNVRAAVRRQQHEQEAAAMNELLSTGPDISWQEIAPHLDAAVGELAEAERNVVLLRYFERRSAGEIGGLLGISEEAAQKRVSRAVERLREFFAKRGITVGAGGLVVVISANAVQAAPAGLAVSISAGALAGTGAATSAVIAATTKTIAMTTLQKTLVTTTVAILAGAGIYEAREAANARAELNSLRQQQALSTAKIEDLERQRSILTNRISNIVEASDSQPAKVANSTPAVETAKPAKSSLSLAELAAKLRQIATLSDDQRQFALITIAAEVNLADSAKAIALGNETLRSNADRDAFQRQLLTRWAENNPREAAEYVLTLPANPARKDLLQNVMGIWGKSDANAAIGFANTLPAGTERDWAFCYVSYFWANKDANAAWSWATALPEGETRVLSIQAILRQLATTAPDTAGTLATQLAGDEQVRAIRALITDTAVSNPTWTAQWVHQFPDGEARYKATEMLVKRWSERDPVAASEWLMNEPQDKGFQAAAKLISSRIYKHSPESAWDWTTRIGDQKSREQQQRFIANEWIKLDPASARKKMAESGLSAETIARLTGQTQ